MNVGRVLQASASATAITRCANRSWGVLAWWGVVGSEAKALADLLRFLETASDWGWVHEVTRLRSRWRWDVRFQARRKKDYLFRWVL